MNPIYFAAYDELLAFGAFVCVEFNLDAHKILRAVWNFKKVSNSEYGGFVLGLIIAILIISTFFNLVGARRRPNRQWRVFDRLFGYVTLSMLGYSLQIWSAIRH